MKGMVGGEAITTDFAQSIMVHGYGLTALEAIELVKRLVGK